MAFAFSSNEENFREEGDETREEAILRCIDEENLEVGQRCWTAVPKPVDPKEFMPDVERILETINERAYEECGECAEDWLDNMSREKLQDLESVVHAAILGWMERHNELPSFWMVEQVQEHRVTEELYAQATA